MRYSTALCALALSSLTAIAADPLNVDPKELPRFPAVEPAEALKTFQVKPGFHLEIAASEPNVASPIAVCFDENGRMFVLEMRDYSEDHDVMPHLGRVRMLEDTNGDGVYDKATIFADDLAWPTGLIWANGGLFVAAVPDIIRFEDADGDGRAEKRQVIFTGLHSEVPKLNVQALPNCFQWGPDNMIHLQVSVGSRGRIHLADQPAGEAMTGDFWFNPRKYSEWGMEPGGGQYGMSYDNYGRRFVCSNSDHLQMYVYSLLGLGEIPGLPAPRLSIAADGGAAEVYRISPDEPWRIIRTRWRVSGAVKGVVEGGGRVSGYFTGATGTTVYRGDAYPPEYVGDTFTGDAGGNLVHHKRLKPNGVPLIGARPAGEEKMEFVASRDTWFRPVNFANAPDGTLYIIDMYREVIEHPWSLPEPIKQHLDLTSGRDRGRIYRLAPDGFKPKAAPQLAKASTAELLDLLDHPNGWTRDTATRLLLERNEVRPAELREKVAHARTSLGRLHALRLLQAFPIDEAQEAVMLGLKDSDAGVRELALKMAAHGGRASKGWRDLWEQMSALATTEPDPRVQFQLALTLRDWPAQGSPETMATVAKRAGSDTWIRAAILSAPDAAPIFAKLVADSKWANDPASEPLLAGFAKSIGAAKNAEAIAEVVSRAQGDPPRYGWLASLAEGMATRGAKPAAAGLDNKFFARVRGVVLDSQQTLPVRTAAARLLGFDDPMLTHMVLVGAAANPTTPAALRTAALASLARFNPGAGTATDLLQNWKQLDAGARVELVRFLAARKSSAMGLLQGIARGQVPAAEIGATEARLLQASKDAEVAALAGQVLPTVSAGTRADVLKQFEPALTLTGDKAKGHTTFTQRCTVCHKLRGEGTAFGPDLESVIPGGKEKLLTHIIDPNREVAPQFAAYSVEMKDGSTLAGILVSESPAQITLREPLGKETPIAREAIARLQTTGRSPMPEGLEAGLTPQDFADLLAFLVGQ